jgi:hypothetical protein
MTAALTSWSDGPAKQAIVDFVASAIQDGPRFVPAAERIAAFDNDGTLWVEQPMAAAVRLRAPQVDGGGRGRSLACGTAAVYIEMLTCARFALLINHDDADREFAYTKAAEKAPVKADQLGWTVVSMRNDWTTVFKSDGAA